jgi:HEAT repeat protein
MAKAELHCSIQDAIPLFVNILNDGNADIRSDTGSLLLTLADHGETQSAVFAATLSVIVAEIQNGLLNAMPSLIELFSSRNPDLRFTTVSLIGKLVYYSELQLEMLARWLTYNERKPSQRNWNLHPAAR